MTHFGKTATLRDQLLAHALLCRIHGAFLYDRERADAGWCRTWSEDAWLRIVLQSQAQLLGIVIPRSLCLFICKMGIIKPTLPILQAPY